MIAATLCNIHRGKGKPAFKIEDFLPKSKNRNPKKEQKQLAAVLDTLVQKEIPLNG